jgi:hypothetical protein
MQGECSYPDQLEHRRKMAAVKGFLHVKKKYGRLHDSVDYIKKRQVVICKRFY